MRLTERDDHAAGSRLDPQDHTDDAAQLIWALDRPGPADGGGRHRRPPVSPARSRLRLLAGAVLAVLCVSAGLAVFTGDDVRAPVLQVSSWVTTTNARQLLAAQFPLGFSDGAPPPTPLTITVDPTREYQVIDGFGASITDSSAAVLYRLDPQARDATMVGLFEPGRGAGLSYLRQPMGASDFVDGTPYTYDDVAPGASDYSMAHFSIEHDQSEILPLLRRAKVLNPQLTIIASPWSAPAWMKTTGSLIGGSLIDDPRIYRAYALYFVKFLRAYASAGVPVAAVTVQNEPLFAPSDYPGMLMSPAQEATFISVLGAALRQARLDVSILAYDHNWAAARPKTAGAVATVPANAYVDRVLSDPAAAPWVGGVAFHCYSGQVSDQAEVHRRFPHAQIVLSECSGYRGAAETPSATFARSLDTMTRLVVNGTRNWAAAVLTWNIALGPQSGPHRGGCGTCTGVVTVDPANGVTRNAEYYALASVSRVARPGAVRIASSSFPPGPAGRGGLITSAFRNRDGSIGLVAYNLGAAPRRFAVRVGDRSFITTLAAGGLGAYSWPGAATPAGDLLLLDTSRMTATASPAAPIDPCCTGDVASRAVDDNTGTRWSTGHSQRPGDYLQVDLGERRHVARVVLDSGTAPGDAPRQWVLYAGDDPVALGWPVAEGAGDGQLTSIDLTGVDARYLRVVTTAATTSAWWSVAEVRVYVHR